MQKMIHISKGMPLSLQWALAFQHLLAVFSGTLIVPMATGLPVAITLLFAGISTLFLQFFTRGKVPLFYSCSFVFFSGMLHVRDICMAQGMSQAMALCYVCFGIFVSGFAYIILGQIMRYVPYKIILKLFPPVLYGSFIMALGVVMISASIDSIKTDSTVAVVAIAVTILTQSFFKGVMKLIPINIGILAATIVSGMKGGIDLSRVYEVPWVAMPFRREYMALTVFEEIDGSLLVFSIMTILPLVLVSLVEHVADLFAISRTTRIDYIRAVGLPRTLSANGLSTMLSAMFGAPAMTAFSQTTGLIALNGVCATRLLRFASFTMIFLAFSPKLGTLLSAIPAAAIGGATVLMYGMVIIVGMRSMVDAQVDFSKTRNMLIISVVLGLTVGIKYCLDDSVTVLGLTLSSLTVAGFAGTLLNVILPDDES